MSIYLKKETKFTFQDQDFNWDNVQDTVEELLSIDFQNDHLLFKYNEKIVGRLHQSQMRNFCKTITAYYNIKP